MRVILVGVRGLPGVEGGVETHVEFLGTELVRRGWNVEIVTRKGYVDPKLRAWNGMKLRPMWAPRFKGVEALVHTVSGVVYAAVRSRPDLVHIHAVGPALAAPVARFCGLKVVFTHHGRDYDREKWGSFAKWALRLGESFGVRFSHECIAISKVIRADVCKRLGRDVRVIPNGVTIPTLPTSDDTLRNFGLVARRYVLMVARFVPEKRQLDLVRAFQRAAVSGWRLALVGEVDDGGSYTQEVLEAIGDDPNVVLTGFQKGKPLQELYGHAGLFVLPSSHEGLPIVLLEALSFGLPVLASDIAANQELELEERRYFPVCDVDVLTERLQTLTREVVPVEVRASLRSHVARKYNWARIAEETEMVYLDAIGRCTKTSSGAPNRRTGRNVGDS